MATIAFRLDAGPSIGSGHLIRCTALAEALKRLGHCILFLCRNKLSYEPLFPVVYFAPPLQNSLDNHYHVQDITDELPELCRVLTEEQVDCIIVDHYGATETYFLRLKEEACLVAAIDDMKPHSFPVDVVINGNIYAERWSYPEAKCELLGSQYVLLRKEFQMNDAKTIHPSVKHIYITSGGADPLGFCLATLHWLSGICEAETEIFVIVGPDFAHSYVKELENCLIKPVLCYHADMRACMDDADLFITSAGSTLYELAACGVPNLSHRRFRGQRAGRQQAQPHHRGDEGTEQPFCPCFSHVFPSLRFCILPLEAFSFSKRSCPPVRYHLPSKLFCPCRRRLYP